MKQTSPEALSKAFVRVIRRLDPSLLPKRFRRGRPTGPLRSTKPNSNWRFPGIMADAKTLGVTGEWAQLKGLRARYDALKLSQDSGK